MRRLEDYISQLRPKEEEKAILIYGSQYRLWLMGTYLGVATWVQDDNIGDSFQTHVSVNGKLLQFVYVADTWELVIRSRKQKATN